MLVAMDLPVPSGRVLVVAVAAGCVAGAAALHWYRSSRRASQVASTSECNPTTLQNPSTTPSSGSDAGNNGAQAPLEAVREPAARERKSESTSDPATATHEVVANEKGQYSVWPLLGNGGSRDLPSGWRRAGVVGSRDTCLEHISRVWKPEHMFGPDVCLQGSTTASRTDRVQFVQKLNGKHGRMVVLAFHRRSRACALACPVQRALKLPSKVGGR